MVTLNIQHKSVDDWRNGPRVPLFTIEHKAVDDAGQPVMIPDPAFVPIPSEDPSTPAATAPLVQKVEQVDYTMPEHPNAGFALVYLKAARTMGSEAALAWLFELAIGTDAYDALAGEADFTMDQLAALMVTVQKRALGGLEAPKDN